MPTRRQIKAFRTLLNAIFKLIQEWLPQRRESIRFTRQIADEIDDTKANVNIAKMFGTTAGISGAILIGAGALATFLTLGAAAPFVMGAGVATAVGGGLVSGGAEIARMLGSKMDLERVEEVLEGDTSKQQEILKKARKLKDFISHISQEEGVSEQEAIQNLLKGILAQEDDYGDQCPTSEELKGLSASQVSRIAMVPVLPFLAGDVVLRASALLKISASAVRSAARGAAVAVTPIMLVIDIYQFVTTVKDIKKGSKSEKAKELRRLAYELEEELRAYEEYKKVRVQ